MPRKAFIADLKEAAEILDIDHLSSLKAGDEDGTITFKFHNQARPTPSAQGVTISAIVPGTITPLFRNVKCTDAFQTYLNIPQVTNTFYARTRIMFQMLSM